MHCCQVLVLVVCHLGWISARASDVGSTFANFQGPSFFKVKKMKM